MAALLTSGLIGGAVALYFAKQVDRRWAFGDVEGAWKASRRVRITAIVGVVAGLLGVAACIGLMAARPSGTGFGDALPAPVPAAAVVAPTASGTLIDPILEEPANLERGQQHFYDEMSSELRRAADLVNRGKDPTLACISVLVTADKFATGFDTAAKKATEQCGREIPIAWAGSQLDVAATRNDRFDSIMECVMAESAVNAVEKRFTDPRTGELRARIGQVCR